MGVPTDPKAAAEAKADADAAKAAADTEAAAVAREKGPRYTALWPKMSVPAPEDVGDVVTGVDGKQWPVVDGFVIVERGGQIDTDLVGQTQIDLLVTLGALRPE